jgi:hypothetical protein
MSHHELGYVVDRYVRAKRAGTWPHDSLDPLLVSLAELLGPEEPQDDALVVHDHTRIPSCRRRPFTDCAHRLLKSARRDIPASHVSSASARGVRPFCGKACRQPVELSVDVVVHLLEPEALEPPRGSWAQVSGRVPAVDEYRPERIELFLGFGLEASERETDGSRKMVSLELVPGQHLHHLHAFPHESPDVGAIDFLRHRHPRFARSNQPTQL